MKIRLSTKGQSKIEYAQLWIWSLMVMLFMGPYVVRGISAMFQSFDDQVQDSYNDPLHQDPQPSNNIYNLPIVDATH